jgi:hypothetical protein
MRKTVKLLGLAALLAFAAPAAWADQPDRPDDTQQQIKELQRQITVLHELMKADSKVTALELRQIRERLDRIEGVLDRVKSRVTTRIASSFTPDAPIAGGRGIVRVSNRLPVDATVRVGGLAFSVPANSTRSLPDQPAGALTYEVSAPGFYDRATQNSSIAAGETLTININPPASTVTALSPFAPFVPLGRGTLRFANRLPVTATVTVNGVAHFIPANSTRSLSAEAGAVTYSVWASGFFAGDSVVTTLGAGESLGVNISPPVVTFLPTFPVVPIEFFP